MSDISFETSSQIRFNNIASLSQKESKGIINFLINKGVVKDVKGANNLLLIVSVLVFALSIYIFTAYVFDINISSNKNTEEAGQKVQANKERIQQLRDKARNNINTTQNAQ
jgi:hypothetical protein